MPLEEKVKEKAIPKEKEKESLQKGKAKESQKENKKVKVLKLEDQTAGIGHNKDIVLEEINVGFGMTRIRKETELGDPTPLKDLQVLEEPVVSLDLAEHPHRENLKLQDVMRG